MAITPKTEQVTTTMTPFMRGLIDQYATEQGVSRAEAVRLLIDAGLRGLTPIPVIR